MEVLMDRLHHWDQDYGIRPALYVICTVTLTLLCVFDLYIAVKFRLMMRCGIMKANGITRRLAAGRRRVAPTTSEVLAANPTFRQPSLYGPSTIPYRPTHKFQPNDLDSLR
jgi:hypothetical protein